MSDPKKDRAVMRALLEFYEDLEHTDEQVEEDLRAEGVDVPAFLARVDARVKEVKEADRTSRLMAARAKLAKYKAHERTHLYDELGHAALLAELHRRQSEQPKLSAFHKNFEEMTDDDLRTLLEDQDELTDE